MYINPALTLQVCMPEVRFCRTITVFLIKVFYKNNGRLNFGIDKLSVFFNCSSARWLKITIKKTANAAVKLKLKIITVFLFISSPSLKLLLAAKACMAGFYRPAHHLSLE